MRNIVKKKGKVGLANMEDKGGKLEDKVGKFFRI